MKTSRLFIALLGLAGMETAYGQLHNMDEVRFFYNFFEDAAISTAPHAEGFFNYQDFDHRNVTQLSGRGGVPFKFRESQVELGGELSFLDVDPDQGSGDSGISDIRFVGRYHLDLPVEPHFTAGAQFTLPTGDEDLGQDKFNFGAFSAVRQRINQALVLAGTLGVNFVEVPDADGGDDRKFSMLLGGGGIYEMDEKLHIIGELRVQTEEDRGIIDGGADYVVIPNGRLRGALAVGFDDGAPDFALQGGFLYSF